MYYNLFQKLSENFFFEKYSTLFYIVGLLFGLGLIFSDIMLHYIQKYDIFIHININKKL